ncbi:MAG: hypothetical protein ACI4S4_03805 [Candidatus Ornithospirochaeta sp.]
MKLSLGLYTQLYSPPASLFDKTLVLVYEPVLSYLYNNPGHRLSLYQSSQMMKHIQRERPEYRSLISTLCRRGEIDPLSGSWSQSILSLLPPKDRVSQIERLTSSIRHEYGVLPTTAFFYGQVWQPLYISLLKNAGIDNVVISTYSRGSNQSPSHPFVMNELGRKERIYPMDDGISSIVEKYSTGEIGYQELHDSIIAALERSNEDKVVFLNIDQLVLGSQREGKGEKPGNLVVDILSSFPTTHVSDIPSPSVGYLPQGWYGRDSVTYGFSSFNELLVYNDSFRYLYNRYITIAEGTQSRNNRFLKKDVSTALFNVATGPLFIHDSQMAPLRYRTRRNFWESLTGAENFFWEYTDGPSARECDWEDIGRNDIVMSNKTYLAVVSPKGASSPEFDYLPFRLNIFDVRTALDRSSACCTLRKSFSDTISDGERVWNTEDLMFSSEVLDKKRSEVQFVLEDDCLPFSISKRYKMRASTFILDVLLSNTSGKKFHGNYSVSVFLSPSDASLTGPEQRMDMVAKGVVRAKTVKYSSKMEDDMQFVFSSTETFTLTEEVMKSRETTSLGDEEFDLGKKIVFNFPLEAEVDESVTYRLVMRASSQKK